MEKMIDTPKSIKTEFPKEAVVACLCVEGVADNGEHFVSKSCHHVYAYI